MRQVVLLLMCAVAFMIGPAYAHLTEHASTQTDIGVTNPSYTFIAHHESSDMTLTSGQGALKFKVLYTRDHFPAEVVAAIDKAHGGFDVDRREGKGETYFQLPGIGIIQISADLKTTQ